MKLVCDISAISDARSVRIQLHRIETFGFLALRNLAISISHSISELSHVFQALTVKNMKLDVSSRSFFIKNKRSNWMFYATHLSFTHFDGTYVTIIFYFTYPHTLVNMVKGDFNFLRL